MAWSWRVTGVVSSALALVLLPESHTQVIDAKPQRNHMYMPGWISRYDQDHVLYQRQAVWAWPFHEPFERSCDILQVVAVSSSSISAETLHHDRHCHVHRQHHQVVIVTTKYVDITIESGAAVCSSWRCDQEHLGTLLNHRQQWEAPDRPMSLPRSAWRQLRQQDHPWRQWLRAISDEIMWNRVTVEQCLAWFSSHRCQPESWQSIHAISSNQYMLFSEPDQPLMSLDSEEWDLSELCPEYHSVPCDVAVYWWVIQLVS